MEVTIDANNNLVIKLPTIHRDSKSGKTILIATTGGAKETDLKVGEKPISVSVNAYIYKD